MYLNEIEDKDTYNTLKQCSCMNCGLIPIFTSERMENHVTVVISFEENPDWTFNMDTEGKKMTDCYCPDCTRKMKLLKLKGGL